MAAVFSFPMSEGRNHLFPREGVDLACVNPANCRNTLPFSLSRQSAPVLYGSRNMPAGFEFHDTETCPSPRIAVLESVEDYWRQDFLKTFTD
jgi:hypothetical protein